MNCINPRPALGVVGTRFLLESAPLRNSKTLPLRRRSLPGPRSARATARCTDHHQRLAALVLRRQTHLVAVELERDHARLALGCENKRVPIDGDLARADAEESAEVDDGGMDPAVPADDSLRSAPCPRRRRCEHPCREWRRPPGRRGPPPAYRHGD